MSAPPQQPAAEREMESSPNPPWRVLEAPTTDEPARSPATTTAAPAGGLPVAVKIGGLVAAALTCAVIAVMVAISGSATGSVLIDGGSPFPPGASRSEAVPAIGSDVGELVVEIVGAVPKPGVYRVPLGSRLVDLLQLAGGYGPRVDTARAEQELNLAAPVKDGEHIRVPSRDDTTTPAVAASAGGSGAKAALVDVNTATQAQLEELPGIGPATAQKIIAAREEAPFGAVDELRSRGVLGEKTFEKLRPLITVG
jgi:competence protein ComEA